jgi:hypothetical protein
MANLDTTSKRRSSVQILSPYLLAPLLVDSTIGQGDRQHIAWTYSGIFSTGAVIGTAACNISEFVSAASGTHSGVGGGIDTVTKRQSSVQMLAPYRLAPKLPDGSIDQADRQHGAFTYSGILTGGSHTGTAACSLGLFAPSFTGAHGVSSSGSPSLGLFTSSASGAFGGSSVTGSGSPLIGEYICSAEGTFANTVTGSGTPSISEFVPSITGAHGISGSAVVIIANFTSTSTSQFGSNPPPIGRVLIWPAVSRELDE